MFKLVGSHRGAATALGHAASSGSIEVLRLLLREGADLSARDKAGQTVVLRAVEGGHTECVLEILAHADYDPAVAAECAREAALGGILAESETLLENSAEEETSHLPGANSLRILGECDAEGNTALHTAAAGGHATATLAIMEHITQLTGNGYLSALPSLPPGKACEQGGECECGCEWGWGWSRAFPPESARVFRCKNGREQKGGTPRKGVTARQLARESLTTLQRGLAKRKSGSGSFPNPRAVALVHPGFLLAHPLAFRVCNRPSGPEEGALDDVLQRCCKVTWSPLCASVPTVL